MIKNIHIDTYQIYDIFHQGKLIIIRPAEAPLDIFYNNKKMNMYKCPHNHTYIYTLKTTYSPTITLTIQNKVIETQVNIYPEFKDEIILSTLVKNEDAYIKPWIDFHLGIGITRFIIYDNSDSNTLSSVLKDYIKKKQVVLISWNVPYTLPISGISGQTTQQNHSIYVFSEAKYIGLFDIDEYINMQHHTNIHDFLNEMVELYQLNLKQIGSFTLKNKFFYNPDNLPTDGINFLNITNCDEITMRGREKNFVVPQNVKTFSVHMITDGKPMFLLDENHIFFNHYVYLNKPDRGKKNTNNIDNSILRHIV
uniref:Glycosyltransferase family 92 protein n=1 Tax=viral metagenome TaxID=1070528 RepID=A0A6C0B8Y8_9ZZZZ